MRDCLERSLSLPTITTHTFCLISAFSFGANHGLQHLVCATSTLSQRTAASILSPHHTGKD